MEPLGVLHLDAEPGWRGGQRQVLELTSRLARRGHRSILACPPEGRLGREAAARGVEVTPLVIRGDIDLRALPRLILTLRRQGLHLVHTHSARTLLLGALLARGLGLPHVHARRVDFAVGGNAFSRIKYRRCVDLFLAVSHRIREVLREAGIPDHRIRVVWSGIDPEPIRSAQGSRRIREELGLDPDTPVVGAVAHLAAHKGHAILAQAAYRVVLAMPDAHFLLAGEGEERPALESTIRRLGLEDRFHLLGFREDVPEILAALDLFAMPSLEEGLGTSVLDAMAAGLPVVGSRAGGIPEAVAHGRNGLLVPPGEPEELAEAILRLLREPEMRRRLGDEGRRRFDASFHVEITAGRTEEAYRDLLSSGGADL